MAKFQIIADEAWTHDGGEPNRYWNFFGGLFGTEEELGRLETELKAIKIKRPDVHEVKWGRLKPPTLGLYKELVDCCATHIERHSVRYRQMFADRAYVPTYPRSGEARTALDVQFRLWYQFIKHAFGLRYLPQGPHEILVRIDEHSSQVHQDALASFGEDMAKTFDRRDLALQFAFVKSSKSLPLQVCDVLMGAAGSYGNKQHDRREPGQKGMTHRQKLRLDLCEHIHECLRGINNRTRGTQAFNWHETTGFDGDRENMLKHCLRIWKFRPKHCKIDKGWQRSQLDTQGRYQGPDIVDAPANWNPDFDGDF